MTLDLIDCPVRAFGGSSGVAEGQIRALFFRYQSLGGYEYATDLLIGPRLDEEGCDDNAERAKPYTRPGDSGTLWFYDPPGKSSARLQPNTLDDSAAFVSERGDRARRLRPIAMQWGGQRVATSDGKLTSYALATFLSSISRVLDVEIVRDWSIGHDEYCGTIGHFAIGWRRVNASPTTAASASSFRETKCESDSAMKPSARDRRSAWVAVTTFRCPMSLITSGSRSGTGAISKAYST